MDLPKCKVGNHRHRIQESWGWQGQTAPMLPEQRLPLGARLRIVLVALQEGGLLEGGRQSLQLPILPMQPEHSTRLCQESASIESKH